MEIPLAVVIVSTAGAVGCLVVAFMSLDRRLAVLEKRNTVLERTVRIAMNRIRRSL